MADAVERIAEDDEVRRIRAAAEAYYAANPHPKTISADEGYGSMV